MQLSSDKDIIRFFMYNKILTLCKDKPLTIKNLQVLTGGSITCNCIQTYCRFLEKAGYLSQEFKPVSSRYHASFFTSIVDSYPIELFKSKYEKFIEAIKKNGYEEKPKPVAKPKQIAVPKVIENPTPHIRTIYGAENTRWTIAPRKSARNGVSGSTLSGTIYS